MLKQPMLTKIMKWIWIYNVVFRPRGASAHVNRSERAVEVETQVIR